MKVFTEMMDYPQSALILQFPAMAKKPKPERPNRLRDLREARDLTLKEVADAIGTSIVQVSRLEVGTRDLDLYWLPKLAAFYGVAPADCLLLEHGALNPQERRLIDTIRELPEPFANAFWSMAESHQHLRGMGDVVPLAKSG